MHRRYRLTEKQEAKLENDAQMDRNAKKNRSDNRITKIDLDNDTMVEAFKHMNYCQLAINSLVTKRFRDVIQTNRHSLARLHVDYIAMDYFGMYQPNISAKIFEKVLPPEEYNEWLIRNDYSKQAPLEDQVESTQNISIAYRLHVCYYKYPVRRRWTERTLPFSAYAQPSNENWPLFQHFVRLITDPFIYINEVRLTYQKDVFNLLARALDSNHSRLQCKRISFNRRGNGQKSITWAKSHIRCNKFHYNAETGLNQDEAFADFFLTGAHCTPSISISNYDLSQALVNFVQKFLDLKNCDECHSVERVSGQMNEVVNVLKRNFANFIVQEGSKRWIPHIFEFVNDNIGRKLLDVGTICIFVSPLYESYFGLKITNLLWILFVFNKV